MKKFDPYAELGVPRDAGQPSASAAVDAVIGLRKSAVKNG